SRARGRQVVLRARMEGLCHDAESGEGKRAGRPGRSRSASPGHHGAGADRARGRGVDPARRGRRGLQQRRLRDGGAARGDERRADPPHGEYQPHGAIRTTKAFIPHFREKRAGLFINTTSIGGLITVPFNSIYHATKWALEGWSESLAFELSQF